MPTYNRYNRNNRKPVVHVLLEQPARSGDDVTFWVRYTRIGVVVSVATVFAALLYAVLSEPSADRTLLIALLLIALALSVAVLALPLARIVTHPRGLAFFYSWSAADVVLIAFAMSFDGGGASPLGLLLFLPLAYGAMAYPHGAVLVMGAGVVGVAATMDFATGMPLPVIVLRGSTLALVAAMCARAARSQRHAYQRQSRLAERLAELANSDSLTGCLNHRSFHEHLRASSERALKDRRPLALVSLDLDDFRTVNEEHGHPAGDQVLRDVAGILTGQARDDDVVARMGGDEFAVLLPGSGAFEATAFAEQAREAVANGHLSHPVTVSVGISVLPELAKDSATLLEQADDALYSAKRLGRDAVRVFDAHDAAVRPSSRAGADLTLYRRIRDLINDGSITSVFQPIVDLNDGTLLGYEALARVRGSRLGPDHWLALAEEVGLRDDLELAMWSSHLAAGQPPAGTALFLNASPAALMSGILLALRHRLPTGTVIEVSEEQEIANYRALVERLRTWRAGGVHVAVDDMGSRQANFHHLVNLAPGYVKLDRSLVAEVHSNATHRALIDAIQHFARAVDGLVIAEGVEHAAQAAALREVGVRYGQGYLFGRPTTGWSPVHGGSGAALPVAVPHRAPGTNN